MDSVNESSTATSLEDVAQAKVEHLPFQDEATAVEEASQEEGEVIGYFELDPSAGLQLMQGENTIYLPPEALGEHVLMSEAGKGCQQIIVVVEEGAEGTVTGLAPGAAAETSFSEECHTVLTGDAFQTQNQVSEGAEGIVPEGHQQVLILSDGSADVDGVRDGVVAVAANGDSSPAEGNLVIYTEHPCVVPDKGIEFCSAAQSEMTKVLKSPDLLQLAEQSACIAVNIAGLNEANSAGDTKGEYHCDSVLQPFSGEPVTEFAADSQAEDPQPDCPQDECLKGLEEIRTPSTVGSVALRGTSQDAPNDTTCMQQCTSMDVASAEVLKQDLSETGVPGCGVTTNVSETGHEIPAPDSIEENEHIGETAVHAGALAHDSVADKAAEDVSDKDGHEQGELQDQCNAAAATSEPGTTGRNGDEEIIPSTVCFSTSAPIRGEAEHSCSALTSATELQSELTSRPAAVGTALQSTLSSRTMEEEGVPSDLRDLSRDCKLPLACAELEDSCATEATELQQGNTKHSNLVEAKLQPVPTGDDAGQEETSDDAPLLSHSIPEAEGDSEQENAEMRHSIQQTSSVWKHKVSGCLSQVAADEPSKLDDKTAEPTATHLDRLVCMDETGNENGILQYNCCTLKELAGVALERHGAPQEAHDDDDRRSPEGASVEQPHPYSHCTGNLSKTGADNFQPLQYAKMGAPQSSTVPGEPLLEAHVRGVMEKESTAQSPLHIAGTDDMVELSTTYAADTTRGVAAGSETVSMEACAVPLADVEDVDQACRESVLPSTPSEEASVDQSGPLPCERKSSEHVSHDNARNEDGHSENTYPPSMTDSKTVDDHNQNLTNATSLDVEECEGDATESVESLSKMLVSSDVCLSVENSKDPNQEANGTPIIENTGSTERDVPDIPLSSEVGKQAEGDLDAPDVDRSVGEELMAALELVPCQESSVVPPVGSQERVEDLDETVPKKEKKRKKRLEDPPTEDAEDLSPGKKRWFLRTPTKPRKRVIIPDSDEDDFDTYESFDIPQDTQRSKSEDAFDALLNIFKIEQAKKAAEMALPKGRKARKVAADATRSRKANAEEAKGRRSACYRKETVQQPQSKSPGISSASGNDTTRGSPSETVALSPRVSKLERKRKSGPRKLAVPRKGLKTVSRFPTPGDMLAGGIHIRCQRPVSSPEKSAPQYHCSKCGFRSARMDNIVRHHKEDCPHTKNFFKWDHEMLTRVTGLDSGYHPS